MGRGSCGSWVNCVMGLTGHGSRKMTHFHLCCGAARGPSEMSPFCQKDIKCLPEFCGSSRIQQLLRDFVSLVAGSTLTLRFIPVRSKSCWIPIQHSFINGAVNLKYDHLNFIGLLAVVGLHVAKVTQHWLGEHWPDFNDKNLLVV